MEKTIEQRPYLNIIDINIEIKLKRVNINKRQYAIINYE